MVTIKILQEANEYVVYAERDGEEPDPLEFFDCSKLGDQVARSQAEAYKKGYEAGYDQGEQDTVSDLEVGEKGNKA